MSRAIQLSSEIDALVAAGDWQNAIHCAQNYLAEGLSPLPALQALVKIYDAQGHTQQALDYYERIVNLLPNSAAAHHNAAVMAMKAQDTQKAECYLLSALRLQPLFFEALNNLGYVYELIGQYQQARTYYLKAQTLQPNSADATYSIACLDLRLGLLGPAQAGFNRLLQQYPKHVDAMNNLATIHLQYGDQASALSYLQHGLTLAPDHLAILCNLMVTYLGLNQFNCLKHVADSTIKHYPSEGAGHYYLGVYYKHIYDLASACDCFARAHSAQPKDAYYLSSYIDVLAKLGKLEHLAYYHRLSLQQKFDPKIHVQFMHAYSQLLCFTAVRQSKAAFLSTMSDSMQHVDPYLCLARLSDNTTQHAVAAHYAKQVAKSIRKLPSIRSEQHTPWRIGYLSPDFNGHAVGLLALSMIKHLDKRQFLPHLYSLNPEHDTVTQAFQTHASVFYEGARQSSLAIAQQIQADGIDLLIDISGYTALARPDILAYQPAAKQAHFLGYPGTLGADYVNYTINTPTGVPDWLQSAFSEQVLYLPESVVCLSELAPACPTMSRRCVGLDEHDFIFACFNASYRIDEETFDCWMQILRATEESKLWLEYNSKSEYDACLQQVKRHGIATERIVFTKRRLITAHWHNALADVFLDTFSLSGGTAGILHAYANQLVVTHAGQTPQSRTGAATLAALSLNELIAHSAQDYVKIAVRLYHDQSWRHQCKAKLYASRQTSSLFNPSRYMQQFSRLLERLLTT